MKAIAAVLAWVLTCAVALGQTIAPAKVVNLGAVNTPKDEVDPFLTPDGRRLLYATNAKGSFDLMVSVRQGGKWSKGIALDRYNSKDADERSPVFLKNGDLYFASNRVPDPSFKKFKNFDIFKRAGPLAPYRLRIVNTRADELAPWIAAAGRLFYFSRKIDDRWRLFVSKGPALGGPGEAKMLENFGPDFHHATLTSDGRTMYLQGKGKDGRWRIYRSRSDSAGRWTPPQPAVNLSDPKSKTGDICPSVNAGGTILYFASDRPGGQGGLDLYGVRTADLKWGK